MANTEEARTDVAQSLQCSFETSSSSHLKQTLPMNQLNIPQFNSSQFRSRHFPPNFSLDNKKVGIPPSHPHQIPPISPYSQIPIPRPVNHLIGSQNHTSGPTHSRSLSQPSFFSLDSLPPLSPSPFRDSPTSSISDQASADASMEDRDASSHSLLPPSPYQKGHFLKVGDGVPPRKAHRRSNSDIPFGFSTVMQSSPPLLPLKGSGSSEKSVSGKDNFVMAKPTLIVKRESNWERGRDGNAEGMGERKSEGDVMEDLFSAYMNLDNIDSLNSSGTDEKNGIENREDLDSRASGTKTNGGDSSDNEAESRVNENGGTTHRPGSSSSTDKREGIKRSAGGDIAPTIRHYRSLSMDSFIGKLQFGDESFKMPPSPVGHPGHLSPSTLVDGGSTPFSLEFGNGEFSGAEMKKIMANDKLAEIAVTDPKRVKRILANRQSAARSKERKMRYITELEHKVQTLQTEATTLSAQLTLLQRDSVGLTNQNNELKFRLQAMEQQAQLRDALNEALTTEVQRLKLATTDINAQTSINPSMFQMQMQHQHAQTSINPSMFQMQNQQTSQHNVQLHQNSPAAAKPESSQ